MKTEHRILALILTLVVILGCMPSWVLASDKVGPADTGQEQVFLEPVIEADEELPKLDSGEEPIPVETEPSLGTWTDPETGEEYPILSSVEDIIPEEISNGEEVIEYEPAEDDVADEQSWRESVFEIALRRFLADETMADRTKRIFERVAINSESPEAVAASFKMKRHAVDQAKNRAMSRLRELVKELEDVVDG